MQERNKGPQRKQDPSLRDLIEREAWQKIQDKFSAVSGVGLRLVDAIGEFVTTYSGKPRLCAELLKESPLKNKVCGQGCLPTFLGGEAAVDRNLGFVCEATGLHNFVTPLRIDNGRALGYFIIGPVILVKPESKEDYRKRAEELCLDPEEFWSAIIEIKVMSFHGAQSLVELIKGVDEFCLKLA